mmetsp:Transcript_4966/g.21285  ORF Transcript_4966/g.21285 Transcript_4966/m.21285 type:complete len:213 (+) Transcript_4966:2191-2829(+)
MSPGGGGRHLPPPRTGRVLRPVRAKSLARPLPTLCSPLPAGQKLTQPLTWTCAGHHAVVGGSWRLRVLLQASPPGAARRRRRPLTASVARRGPRPRRPHLPRARLPPAARSRTSRAWLGLAVLQLQSSQRRRESRCPSPIRGGAMPLRLPRLRQCHVAAARIQPPTRQPHHRQRRHRCPGRCRLCRRPGASGAWEGPPAPAAPVERRWRTCP